MAQQCLLFFEARRRRDAERGNKAAVDFDARRILELKQRISVDCWLIRQNSLRDPGYYPLRIDTDSVDAINQATHRQ